MNLFKVMINSAVKSLIDVLKETEKLLSLKQNDFAWSSWNNVAEANVEIYGHIARLQAGDITQVGKLSVLFAPTGPIQEISLSSGWGERFLALAKKFDRAAAKLGVK